MVPALAVADALVEAGAEVSFVGTRERAEAELVPAAGYEIDFIAVRGVDRRNPIKAAVALGQAGAAVRVVRRLLAERGADAVMGGGGYVAAPAGIAAAAMRLPLVLTEADSHLGLANRLLAPRAHRVCLAFPIAGRDGDRYLVTGRPVSASIARADRGRARERFGIAPDVPCLLIFGGSLGALRINRAAADAFGPGGPAAERPFHVLHIAGARDYPAIQPDLAAAARYTLIDYLPDLADALAASDLVLSRAGGSVFELTAAGKPAVLVPYPHAAGSPSACECGLDAAGRRRPDRRGRGPRPRSSRRRDSSRCSPTPSGSRGWPRHPADSLAPDAAERVAAEIMTSSRHHAPQ